MSPRQEKRELRKRILLARSSLYRLEVSQAVLALTDRLNEFGSGGVGSSTSLRGWLLNLFLRRIASRPVAKLLGLVGGILSFTQVLRLGSALVRSGRSSGRATVDAPVVERGSA